MRDGTTMAGVMANTITDVGGLWPLAGVLVLGFILWLYRVPLGRLLGERPFRVRHKDTEFDVGHPSEAPGGTITTEGKQAAPPPEQRDEGAAQLAVPDAEPQEDEEETGLQVDEAEPAALSTGERMNIALARREFDEAERLFREAEAELTDDNERVELAASYHYFRFSWGGDPDALPQLEAILNGPPVGSEIRPFVLRLLAQAYERAGNPDLALATFEEALRTPRNDQEEVLTLTGLARVLSSLNRVDEAIARLSDALGRFSERDLQRQLYAALGDLLKEQQQLELHAFVLDKLVELRPRDSSRLFNAAYAYSQAGLQDLALVHYLDLVTSDYDNAIGLNNLGVVYEHLSLPIRSIQRYRQSADLGETLAMANIANRLTAAGFANEAQELLMKAAEAEDVHPNVGSHIASLATRETQEADRERQLTNEATRKRRFIRALISARFEGKESALTLTGTWLLPDLAEIEISQTDGNFTGTWDIGIAKMRLSGSIANRSVTWIRAKWEVRNWTKTPLEYEFAEKARGYGFISPTGDSLELFEPANLAEPFSVLRKKAADESP